MLGEKMEEALNGQLNAELYSAYLYLSMSAYYHSINLPGFANWMRVQWAEELKHVFKFFDYIAENGRVVLRPVEAPPAEWDSALAPFEAAYSHEQKVTGLINALAELATSQGDEVTRDFLQWYIDNRSRKRSPLQRQSGRSRLPAIPTTSSTSSTESSVSANRACRTVFNRIEFSCFVMRGEVVP